jgi:hypothetical protein
VAGRWPDDYRGNIISKYDLAAEFTVKQENEMDLGMQPCNPFQGFISEPTNTIQFTRHQEAGIYRYRYLLNLLVQ